MLTNKSGGKCNIEVPLAKRKREVQRLARLASAVPGPIWCSKQNRESCLEPRPSNIWLAEAADGGVGIVGPGSCRCVTRANCVAPLDEIEPDAYPVYSITCISSPLTTTAFSRFC